MIDTKSLEMLMETAALAARRAGEIARESYGNPRNIRQKTSVRDLVTDTDFDAQEAVLSLIHERHPHDSNLAEEAPSTKPDGHGHWPIPSGVCWLVDPLDGTSNYSNSLPIFCASVGVAIDGEPVVGALYDPLRDELILGARGHGVTLNGQPLAPLTTTPLPESVIAVDWAHAPQTRHNMIETVRVLAPHCRTVRSLGSAALALAYIACGRLQVYANYGLKPWDTCAAAAVILEVGGTLRRPHGPEWDLGEPRVLAGHATLLDEIQALLEAG